MLLCLVENRVAPAQRVGGSAWQGQRQHRQHEDLRVPEGVTVVAWARQPFRRDGPTLPTRSRLQNVEERKAYRLLDLRIPFQLDIRARPEVVQVGTLLRQQALPARQARGGQRRYHLVVHGG